MRTHTVGAWMLAATLTTVMACGQAAAVSSTAGSGTAATSLRDATVPSANANDANGPWHGDPNTLGAEHILHMLHMLPHEAMAGLSPACDANAVHSRLAACGEDMPGSAQAQWSACSAMPFGHGPPPTQDGNQASMPPPPHHGGFGGRHGPGGASSGQLTVTASVTPADANAACDTSTVITAQRQAQFNVTLGDPNDPNRPRMQLAGSNQETVSRAYGSSNQNVTLTLDMNRTLTNSAGTVLHQGNVNGTVHIQETRTADHTPPARVVDGTLSVNGDAVVLTGVQSGDPRACHWPTAGSMKRTSSDGVAHTLVFTSTCGSATLDGASVTLPSHFGHGGHHGGHGHDGPPPEQRP